MCNLLRPKFGASPSLVSPLLVLGHPGVQQWGVGERLVALSHHSRQQTGTGSSSGHAGPRWEGQKRHASDRPLCEASTHTHIQGQRSLSITDPPFDPLVGVCHRPRQTAEAVAALPGQHGAQLRRAPAGDRLPAAHSGEAGGHAGRLEGMRHIGGSHPMGNVNRLISVSPAWRLRDGAARHVWGGGRSFVPRRRLQQGPAVREEVPPLHADVSQADRAHRMYILNSVKREHNELVSNIGLILTYIHILNSS